jgi:hypothetical protein
MQLLNDPWPWLGEHSSPPRDRRHKAFDRMLQALEARRTSTDPASTCDQLKAALEDSNTYSAAQFVCRVLRSSDIDVQLEAASALAMPRKCGRTEVGGNARTPWMRVTRHDPALSAFFTQKFS